MSHTSFGDAMKQRQNALMAIAQNPKIGGALAGFQGTGLAGFVGTGLWSDIKSSAKRAYSRFKPYAYSALNNFVDNFAKGYKASPSEKLSDKALSGLSMAGKEAGKDLLTGAAKAISGEGLNNRLVKGQKQEFDRVGNPLIQVNASKHFARPKI